MCSRWLWREERRQVHKLGMPTEKYLLRLVPKFSVSESVRERNEPL